MERIEKGESEIQRRRAIDQAIEEKFEILREKYEAMNPDVEDYLKGFSIDDIHLSKVSENSSYNKKALFPPIPAGNSFEYTIDEDRFLAYGLFKYGYG